MKSKKECIHYVPAEYLNPPHPIMIKVIGVGGNGIHMLEGLTKINSALKNLGHMGINVTAYDPDKVEVPNLGRQMFYQSDVGKNKAEVYITRINRTFGWGWRAEPRRMFREDLSQFCNVLITCVDKGHTRSQIGSWFRECTDGSATNAGREVCHRVHYWMDLGNSKNTGQFILGSKTIKQPDSQHKTIDRLQTVIDYFPNIADNDLNEVDEPSCSTMQALSRQSLFINHHIAGFAAELLFDLLFHHHVTTQGLYYNGEMKHMVPIQLT